MEKKITKLIGGLIVKNEEKRYLKITLEHLSLWVDEIVILDNGSTDKTVQLCESFPKVIKPVLIDASPWYDSKMKSKLLNELMVPRHFDWAVIIDADEIFENRIIEEIGNLINQDYYVWFSFPYYHFWMSMDYYRCDGFWSPGLANQGMLFKNISDWYWFPDRVWHCPRIPPSIETLPGIRSDIRVKHFGYARKEDLETKLKMYYSWVAKGDDGKIYDHLIKDKPFLLHWKE